MNTFTSTLESAQQDLADAGIASTMVDECDDARCAWCDAEQIPLAA